MSKISHLTELLSAAQVELSAALADGKPTRTIRADIARLEAELSTAQAASDATQRTADAQEAAKVQAAGAALADAEHAAIQAAGPVAELAELVPEIITPVERDPMIDAASHAVARAADALEKAEAAHSSLAGEESKIRQALATKMLALGALKARRAAGAATADDALEALGLPDDIADLERLLAAATEKTSAADPYAQRDALATAQKHLQQAVESVKLRTLRDRIALAESALIAAYHELRAAENASEAYRFRPSGDYRANQDLKAILARH